MKTKRQQALLDVIRNRHIETQEELTAVLREAGFAVTQATVSRDIKELRLIKTLGRDGRSYYASVTPSRTEDESVKLHTLFHEAVLHVDQAINIAVVKTISGTAGAVCTAIDALRLPSIVGSLAGDDTIILVVRTEAETTALCERLRELLDA